MQKNVRSLGGGGFLTHPVVRMDFWQGGEKQLQFYFSLGSLRELLWL